ncbi:MAG TPA: HDOD domain-containing protein, partial [Urbifossiella sp.]|nr:HDOD domain-containing protein [Urbifossiella sp.]
VTGAVLARDLATRTRRPDPEDDLVAGLLRDLGVVPLQRAFPYAWRELAPVRARCSPARVCAAEVEAFGVSHPEVGAELLSRWHLPGNVVTPIRHHHDPVTPGASWADRAELLYFVECLTRLDAVAGDTTEFARLLTIAMHRFRLPPRALAEWLGAVAPKVDEFIAIAGADVGPAPNLVATLAAAFERHGVTPDAA